MSKQLNTPLVSNEEIATPKPELSAAPVDPLDFEYK
jgi:hypothetical protein